MLTLALVGIALSSLTLLTTLLFFSRLHKLSEAVASAAAFADACSNAEAVFLREQVKTLQAQVLALTAPGVQARLHVQDHPEAQAAPLREVPKVERIRNPMQIEVPEGWQHPSALGPIEDDGAEVLKWEPLGEA